MKKYIKIISGLILGFVLISLTVFTYFKIFPLKSIEAGSGENVWGFAWSDNVGWISFNNTSGGGANNYGVNITDGGAVGALSGYAWSTNAGWISFNGADLIGCPVSPCTATVDKATGQVFGWAKFLTTNDWIRLKDNGCNVSINRATGDFSGWAWGGETGGWISFNCNQAETGNICPSTNYKVRTSFSMNVIPTVTLGSAPNPFLVSICSNPAYSFSWIFNDIDFDGAQSQYQLQVDKEGTFASFVAGEVDITIPLIVNKGVLQTKDIILANTPGLNQLDYNTNYKWRIRVWDNWGGVSPWVNGTNFTSPIHIYPSPNFIWAPITIIEDELIQFCSIQEAGVCSVGASVCYGASYPSCLGSNFTWALPLNAEFDDGSTASTPNPVIKFGASGKNQTVSLQIQDTAGVCSVSKDVNVTLPLPKYIEILPY